MSLHEKTFDGTGARVQRQLCEALLSEGQATSLLIERGSAVSWRFGSSQFRARGRRGAFGRYRLQENTIETRTSAGWHPAGIDCVLSAVAGPSPAMDVLRIDLLHTKHLSDLNALHVPAKARRHHLTVSELEAALHEGHPYHPCFKARSGFSDDDHLRFGPEAGRAFRLTGVLFHHTLVQQSLPHDGFWQEELGNREWARITALAEQRGLPVQDFRLLPLHPWQWAKLQDNPLLQEWRASGQAVEIGPVGDSYCATQSVRTLMNADAPMRAHVKTAMAMRNTSSLRTIIPATVTVAPAISKWLADVLASDPLFETHFPLTLLPEYAGIIAGRGTPLDGHLAAIWRQSPESLGLPGDQMMPFNALALTEPDGAPLIAPWIERHGLETWVAQLVEVAVLPVWHLMVAHGIGLEAHGQNLILHHENGWPMGVIARDFHDGVEYFEPLLSRPELCPDLAALDPVYADAPLDAYHKLSTADGLRELVMDTLFVFNLSDLSDLLQRRYGFSEAEFWQRVRGRLDRYGAEHGLQERQAAFSPFAPLIHAESLITRKIKPGRSSYRHLIVNSLATAKDC